MGTKRIVIWKIMKETWNGSICVETFFNKKLAVKEYKKLTQLNKSPYVKFYIEKIVKTEYHGRR